MTAFIFYKSLEPSFSHVPLQLYLPLLYFLKINISGFSELTELCEMRFFFQVQQSVIATELFKRRLIQ